MCLISEFGRLFLCIRNMILMAFVKVHNRGVTTVEPSGILPAQDTASDPLVPGLLPLPAVEKRGRPPLFTFQEAPVRELHGWG